MTVQELIAVLKRFPPEAPVRISISWPDRVTETYEHFWVGESEGSPQLNAALDLKGLRVYVGCVLRQQLPRQQAPGEVLDLGQYASVEDAARVRDFYVFHKGLEEPLNYPAFAYEKWIPPRTVTGEYNPHIAEILKKKLLSE